MLQWFVETRIFKFWLDIRTGFPVRIFELDFHPVFFVYQKHATMLSTKNRHKVSVSVFVTVVTV